MPMLYVNYNLTIVGIIRSENLYRYTFSLQMKVNVSSLMRRKYERLLILRIGSGLRILHEIHVLNQDFLIVIRLHVLWACTSKICVGSLASKMWKYCTARVNYVTVACKTIY